MFDSKFWKLLAIGLIGGALVIGCDDDDDDASPVDETVAPDSPTPGPDVSPTPGPDVTPEYLDFDTVMTYVDCTGTDIDSEWYYELETVGWAMDAPYVVVYDDYDVDWYDHDPNSTSLWTEDISIDVLSAEYGDATYGGYSQLWVRDDLTYVDSFEVYTEDVSTIFECQYFDGLTFVFYGTDYWDETYEICTAIGAHPETFGADCLY